MTLMRWSPWQELESVNSQLSRLLESGTTSAFGADDGRWAPSVDIRETDDALLVQAELPGIDKKDVHVDVHDGVLTVSGERHYEKEENEKNVHRIERAYGKFSRSFSLPANVETDKVEAHMSNGVLEVRLPKSSVAKPSSIEIH
ncbi:Hsp20/alpha crystallin family protein [Mariprofundus erugo]|uniref:Hsp20/alpha crystallin family protein n=1 Tax=Mariprofundus erugo TaxID=2528639 RepID=A0A5R9GNQ5_9PROT|nr:Hsp20/alpha crystallin family protein [Mariprofundus erugo]TLS65937.1 Hsp20/alpha crystallin family protein [Mariprofundus erugo]TLS76406.1 Hsp20/alpha crystallin family protein [Mariprofundus erugo]